MIFPPAGDPAVRESPGTRLRNGVKAALLLQGGGMKKTSEITADAVVKSAADAVGEVTGKPL